MTKKMTALLVTALLAVTTSTFGQNSPVDHMSYLGDRDEVLRNDYMSYMSEVAHGERIRKMEKRRKELIASVQQAIREGNQLRPYQGDATLRNAFVEYWNVLLHVFREDYDKIIDMEEVAERSYDMMEAYILAKEKVDEKLHQSYEKVPKAYETFAAAHNVTLTEANQSKLDRKLAKVGKVNAYADKLFLVYFKSAVQELTFFDAYQKSDINAIEQSRSALQKYATEGLAQVDTIKSFENDASLVNACRKILQLHLLEAEKKIPLISDYLIKADEFKKLQKSFESKPANTRTQSEVDNFNKAVNSFNKEVNNYNKNSQELVNNRNKAETEWLNSRRRFMDTHMPYK